MKVKKKLEELLQEHYWVIDILPEQVPRGGQGQFFAVEKYFLDEERILLIKQKHINLVLKLNCYMDMSIDNGMTYNPSPDVIDAEMRKNNLFIMMEDSVIISSPDDTQLTVFNPDESRLELIEEIAWGEGLFVWAP